MKLYRNEQGLLRGDIQYDIGFPATVMEHIPPVIFPCGRCGALMLHVAIQQPTGLAIKIPFTSKPLAATGRDFGIVCNTCTCTSGLSGRELIDKLERRVVPRNICEAIDRYYEDTPDAPPAYTKGFAGFILANTEQANDCLRTWLAYYEREFSVFDPHSF